MDSLTQATLGAAVAEACLGRKLGWRAVVLGAIVGTLPDLDILIYPMLDEVDKLYWHRGLSHSLLVTFLVAPVLGWLVKRRLHRFEISMRRATVCVFLIWSTHVLIDCFTTYGTQIFEPFSSERFSFHIFFIIDPLYTLPLLLGVLLALCFSREGKARRISNGLGLTLSSLYVIWAFSVKVHVDAKFEDALTKQGISKQRFFSTPTPLNTLLWRCLAEGEEGYWSGYYSIMDPDADIEFRHIDRNESLLPKQISESREGSATLWFSEGYFQISQLSPNEWIVSDLRLGEIPRFDKGQIPYYDYILSWKLKQLDDGSVQILTNWSEGDDRKGLFQRVWQRMLGDKEAMSRP